MDFEQSLRFFNNRQSRLKNFYRLYTLISPNDFFVWSNIFGCVSIHPIWAWIPKNVVLYQSNQCLFCWYLIWTSSNLCGSLTFHCQGWKILIVFVHWYLQTTSLFDHTLLAVPASILHEPKYQRMLLNIKVINVHLGGIWRGLPAIFAVLQKSTVKAVERLRTLISLSDFFMWPYSFNYVFFHPIWV